MKHYKLKLADKAALLNKLEKVGVQVEDFDIKDNKLNDTFEFTINDPEVSKIVDAVIRQSPKIDKLKEKKKNLKNEIN
jgi:cell division protein FtsX